MANDSTAISVDHDGNEEWKSGSGYYEAGGQRSSRNWPTTEEILGPHDEQPAMTTFLRKWDIAFTIACVFAVFHDPLYPYIPIVDGDHTCYYWDQYLMWSYFGLRSALDLFYAMDVAIFCRRRICSKPNAKTSGDSSTKRETRGEKSFKARTILKLLPILPRVFLALPIPQLYGSLWYQLSVQREVDCWWYACQDNSVGCDISGTNFYFYCGTEGQHDPKLLLNITHIEASCPINPQNATIFDFGIFLYALQSNMTRSTSIPRNMFQSFWWGLRNLSSFGSNLQTSLYGVEIFFAILVSISGIVLFLIYLNTRVQMSQQRSNQLKVRSKMQRMNLDIDLWLYKNGLYDKNLKMVIMKNLHQKVEENKEVDVEDILSLVPIIHQRRIMWLLNLNLLKKVPMLENMNENVLKAICEHLKLVKYSEDKYIVREGEPLDKMLFITQGTAWSYPTHASGSSAIKCLVKGDFYGEELLNWASKLPSLSEFPYSTRIVKAHTKVEAFAIRANDLNIVVSKFLWHFSKMLGQESQSQRWQHLAACSIQEKWRRRHARPV